MEGLVKISKYAGMREDLVQARGGNSSYKIDNSKMAIKSSGIQMADVSINYGFSVVDYKKISNIFLNCKNLDKITESKAKEILSDSILEGTRPSIETFLHSISGIYSLHTHPIVVNALACRHDFIDIVSTIFPDCMVVPYATPGVELAKVYFKTFNDLDKSRNDIIFLKNHGLLVSADTADEVIEKNEYVIKRIENYLHVDNSLYRNITDLWRLFPDKIIWRVTDINVINAYSKGGIWNHSFCPDCVVFLGKSFLSIPKDLDSSFINEHIKNTGIPTVIEYDNTLYIVSDSVKKALEIQSVLSFSAQVGRINSTCQCDYLSEEEQSYLINWDSEKYRKNIR